MASSDLQLKVGDRINTVEALDLLPVRSVVLDDDEDAWQRIGYGDHGSRWALIDEVDTSMNLENFLPATLLYIGSGLLYIGSGE